MARWILKAALQGSLSLLPRSAISNYVLQRYVTKSVLPTKSKVARRLDWCAKHLNHFHQYNSNPLGTVLELGTGWIPTVPLGMFLCGVGKVISIDIKNLQKTNLQQRLLDVFFSFSFDDLQEILPRVNEERFQRLLSCQGLQPSEIFKQLGIEFVVTDAQHTSFPSCSVDYFISNTTLEHIPQEIIEGIFYEFNRLAKPSAVMSHLIDMGDHYSYFDTTITPYHFLQHGRLLWRLVNNELLYQNRLRVSDYREIHRKCGFIIVSEQNQLKHASKLVSVDLAPEFINYDRDDLAPTSSWIVSQTVER